MEETGIQLIHWCEAWEEHGIRRINLFEGKSLGYGGSAGVKP
jgi:hypothetical protein